MRRRLSSPVGDVELTPQAARLLELLSNRPREVVSRAEIAAAFWPTDPPATPNASINNAVSKLRTALADPPEVSRLLKNVTGQGYELLADVTLEGPRALSGLVVAALVVSGALGVTLALFSQAVAMVAVVYAVFFALLLASLDHLEDAALLRGAISVVLIVGMAYVPSAWTLYELAGEVTNFEALPPAPFYATVMGMKFLPLFALGLACWTFRGSAAGSLPPRTLFWSSGALCLGLTAAGLAAYSGDLTIWRANIDGAWRLAGWYVLVVAANVAFAQRAYRTLATPRAAHNHGLLKACAFAYMTLLLPAVVIGGEYNNINRHFLDKRRPAPYRATHPEAALAFAQSVARGDLGNDLRNLLRDKGFQKALKTARFYRVDLDEQFQSGRKALTFGYETGQVRDGKAVFRLVRFPRDVADAIGFEGVDR